MTISARHLTADDLWNMPDHGGHNELIHGELRPMSPTNFQHGDYAMHLGSLLAAYVRKQNLGTVTAAETGFRLSAETVLAPDAGFVAKHRISSKMRDKYFPGAPDLALEVLSPSDRSKDVAEKIELFLGAGTKVVWVLNPKKRTLTVHRKDQDPIVLTPADSLTGEDVVPGFKCNLSEIFEND